MSFLKLKRPRLNYILFFCTIAFFVFLQMSYRDKIISKEGWIFFILFFNLAVFVFLIGIYCYKFFFNPLSIFSFFIFSFSYVFLNFSTQNNLNEMTTFFVVLFHILIFVLTFIFLPYIKFNFFRSYKIIPLRTFYYVVFYLGLIVSLLEVFLNGGFNLFFTLSNKASYIDQISIPMLHYLHMALVVIPGIGYILYRKRNIAKIKFHLNSIISVFFVLNGQSRQLILLMFFIFIFSYLSVVKKNNSFYVFLKISNRFFLRFMLLFMFVFLLLGNVRTLAGLDDDISIKKVLIMHAGIDNVKNMNVLELWWYLYGTKNFYTLDEFISNFSVKKNYAMGLYMLKPIISFFLLDRLGYISYDQNFDGFKSLATYLWEPYADFGLLGVFLFTFLLALVSKAVYKEYIFLSDIRSCIQFPLLIFSLGMSVFTNYFFTFFVFLMASVACFIKDPI